MTDGRPPAPLPWPKPPDRLQPPKLWRNHGVSFSIRIKETSASFSDKLHVLGLLDFEYSFNFPTKLSNSS